MRTHKSETVQKMLDDMAKDHWWVKLKRWTANDKEWFQRKHKVIKNNSKLTK